jgi:hypothetical protein
MMDAYEGMERLITVSATWQHLAVPEYLDVVREPNNGSFSGSNNSNAIVGGITATILSKQPFDTASNFTGAENKSITVDGRSQRTNSQNSSASEQQTDTRTNVATTRAFRPVLTPLRSAPCSTVVSETEMQTSERCSTASSSQTQSHTEVLRNRSGPLHHNARSKTCCLL